MIQSNPGGTMLNRMNYCPQMARMDPESDPRTPPPVGAALDVHRHRRLLEAVFLIDCYEQ